MADKRSTDTGPRAIAAETQSLRSPSPTSCDQSSGCVPSSGRLTGPALELALQRHIRLVQALRIPRIRHPLAAHLIWRFAAQGRA